MVGTRPIDLEDATRFAPLDDRSELQAWKTRCLCFSPSDARWSSLFREGGA
jgi:hypothetical protein